MLTFSIQATPLHTHIPGQTHICSWLSLPSGSYTGRWRAALSQTAVTVLPSSFYNSHGGTWQLTEKSWPSGWASQPPCALSRGKTEPEVGEYLQCNHLLIFHSTLAAKSITASPLLFTSSVPEAIHLTREQHTHACAPTTI